MAADSVARDHVSSRKGLVIPLAEAAVIGAEIYFAVGILFAILFAWRGAAAIDPAARDATIGFRLVILPASALLWPFLLRRWWRRSPAGDAR